MILGTFDLAKVPHPFLQIFLVGILSELEDFLV